MQKRGKTALTLVGFTVMLAALLALMASIGARKDGFDIDEFFTYGLANSYHQPFLNAETGRWISGKAFSDYLTASGHAPKRDAVARPARPGGTGRPVAVATAGRQRKTDGKRQRDAHLSRLPVPAPVRLSIPPPSPQPFLLLPVLPRLFSTQPRAHAGSP